MQFEQGRPNLDIYAESSCIGPATSNLKVLSSFSSVSPGEHWDST
jgi:hypothetical protein